MPATGVVTVIAFPGSIASPYAAHVVRARAKSSDRRLTCSDAAVERLRSGAGPVPSRRQTDRQAVLTWARVECSPCRWRAQWLLRRTDSGRWLP